MPALLPPLLAALALVAPARATTLSLSTHEFSPRVRPLEIAVSLDAPQLAGLRLVRGDGQTVGWIAPPAAVTSLNVTWDGRIDGRRVNDGYYWIRVVAGGAVVATQAVHVDTHPPLLLVLRVTNGSTRFQGDTPLLTTVSPNGDGFRDVAYVSFTLREAATVTLEATRTVKVPHPIYTLTKIFARGAHTLTWAPASNLNPRTYLLVLTAVDRAGNRIVYGAQNAFVGRAPRGPVVRIQGIDAGFDAVTYAAGQTGRIHIATDEPSLTLQVFHVGPERNVVYADNQLAGLPVDAAKTIDWRRWTSEEHTVTFRIPGVPSGFYFVKFTGADGRIGYAPFVVHPTDLGRTSRVLVVLPTNTWEAYNFQDDNGDGYGDTWYAGPPNRYVSLSRTYTSRGVPPHFDQRDLPFLHWLYWSGKTAEFISDSDFDLISSGDALAKAYNLIVFEGHEEYVTSHEYDVTERFRNLGGNLIFLSANNFFWHVDKVGQVLHKVGEWRQAGRPEAALIGVEYRANDEGQHQGNFVVQNSAAVPWLWSGTGLTDGSALGTAVGGYGIEIDATSPQSPPGTTVVAQIPDLFGPGISAQMAYYELPNGAKVFAAGALDFGGSATSQPVTQMLDNLWARLSQP